MKFISLLMMFSVSVMAAPNAPKRTLPISKTEQVMKKNAANKEPNALDKKPEDCDTKAKKPVEITPDSISLSGTTGCSLDEAKP